MRVFSILVAFALLFSSCDDKTDATQILVDAGFSDYVNAFTSGVVSSQSNVRIVLAEPYMKAAPGEILPSGILELDPSVDGQAVWVDNQTIEFRPNEKLESGRTYTVSFELGDLMEVSDDYETMEFAFTVIKQSLFVSVNGVKTIDMNDLTKQEMVGTIRTSDLANNEGIEQCLKATQDGKELTVTWEHKDNSKVHTFSITGVERRKSESFVLIEWDGESIGSDMEDDKEIRIPPLGEFTLLQVKTLREPGLHFSIQFSDPVDPNQDFEGLIYLNSRKKLRLKVDKNEIKAFPVEKLSNIETVNIDQSIKNIKGNQLQESYEREVEFNMVNPAVQLIGKGVIMPTSGNITFPFRAVNLKAVNLRVIRIFEDNVPQFMQENQLDGHREMTRVGQLVYDGAIDLVSEEPIDYGVWNNFSIDIGNLIEAEPGAIYRVMLAFEPSQSLFPCGEAEEGFKSLKKRELNFVDGRSYFYPNEWYSGYARWDERDDPCSPSYYRASERAVSTNIISSNLGMISKQSGENRYDVIVTDLRSTDPIRGVKVMAYNYQNRPIGEGKTNGDGMVRLETDGTPYLLVAENGKQKGYLRVDNGSSLSMSLFEVGGKEINKGIKGFIYGERGVWRPGDTIHLSFMLEDKLNTLPASHPIVLEINDPKGKLTYKQVNNKGVEGLYYFKVTTQNSDPTGVWQARVMVGNSTFYKSLKIETIKPNRIRINYDFADILTSKSAIKSTLESKWLYGSPGSNLKTKVEYELANLNTTFKGYDDYQFDDRSRKYYPDEAQRIEGTTNSEGKLTLTFPVKQPRNPPGMLKVKVRTKVFESGGDFSQDYISAKYSPYRSYAGIKMDYGKNWTNSFNTEESLPMALAAVSEYGKPINRKLRVSVYKLKWSWWWEGNGSNELTRYINTYNQVEIYREDVSVTEGKKLYSLKLDQPTWGRLLVVVEDPISNHRCSEIVYADYPGWWSNDGSGSEAASMLSIKTHQKEYKVGESIQVSVPSGGVGNIYVTVEKGDEILDQFWVEAADNTTTFNIDATSEMAPNVYVSATLIQPHAQTENSLPIRLYGVTPVYINDPQTHVEPLIQAPDEIRPESTFKVKVSEKEGKAMAYSLAVVDEGLLSLTRFKTPDAWSTFYSKEALKIKTWDLYKYVMNAKTGKMIPLLAVGGDEALNMEDDKDAKRFKPVVKYLGPFFLDDGDQNEHEIDIPNYIGAVRVMVVAGYEGAYGSEEKEVLVKQPLMVMSTLPRVVGPSERIRVPVNVISLIDKAHTVNVEVKSNDMLKIIGSNKQQVNLTKAGEQTIYFEYEVARKLGVAEFRVDLTSGSEKAFEEVELKVRAPNPHISQSEFTAVEAGANWKKSYQAVGIQGSNSAAVTVSRIPDLGLQKQLNYLMRYPHGCIEQTTSAVFPQLFLSNLIDLSAEQEEKIQTNVLAGLNRLRQFQRSDGSMGYWPGSYGVSEWGTNYAGHFMIEAKEKGYDMPPGVLQQLLKYQINAASDWSRTRYNEWGRYGGDLIQSYRLYTLALAGRADIGAMNRLKNDPKLSRTSAWRLAAAYAMLGRHDAANQLIEGEINISPYREMGYCYGSHIRDLAMIIETMSYLQDKSRGSELILEVSKELKSGWHSTQTRAYALIGISKFIGTSDPDGKTSFDLVVNGEEISMNTNLPVYQFELKEKDLKSGELTFTNNSDQMLFVNFTQSGIPVEIEGERIRDDLKMNISYRTMDNGPIDIKRIKQGQDFKAVIIITHPGVRSTYDEVALNQIFPSGWQIINTRLNEGEAKDKKYDYQDIRDDRIYTYFDLRKGKSLYLEVLLNATFCGKFYQPGVFCAPMYDESIQALDPGQWVEVIPNEN